mmetsp:Transcript_4848/g.9793  ORF Transcript_4848/g.9793 Transcript_4848/m.9793 type:complete len:86 (+) Transcript_4848:499-756(+)
MENIRKNNQETQFRCDSTGRQRRLVCFRDETNIEFPRKKKIAECRRVSHHGWLSWICERNELFKDQGLDGGVHPRGLLSVTQLLY